MIYGIHEKFEGLRDFPSFDDYLANWIRPNLLADLETVLEGARQQWEAQKHEPGAPGRGDFMMATIVLAAMDHLGAFLAESRDHHITAVENIARIAKHMPSAQDIFAIVGNLGRNGLIHATWPQTAIMCHPPPGTSDPQWAFGLSFNANSDLARHNTLHTKTLLLKHDGVVAQRKVLKLVLNVHVLRRELQSIVESGKLRVRQKTFERVRNGSELMGDPSKYEELDELFCPHRKREKWKRKFAFQPKDFVNQMLMVRAKAQSIGAWDGEPDQKYSRSDAQPPK